MNPGSQKQLPQHNLKLTDKTIASRQSDYEHTISGVLHRRVDLHHEAERLRDRMAEIRNDIHAIDRTLNVLGYKGDLDAAMPRQKRNVLFGRGELAKAVSDVLRTADGPLTSRQIAQEIVAVNGQDARDRKYVSDLVKRVGKVLRVRNLSMRTKKGTDNNGNIVWCNLLK